MANIPIQLGSLDFDEIKDNLKSFLQNSDNNLDIDFDGSIANTIVDLLSYNTMYYAFYSNMLMNESFMDSAQRVESLVSLSKPLGYSISHKNGSSVVLTLKNTGTTVANLNSYTSAITGINNGVNYSFTYVNPLNDIDTQTSIIAPNESKSFRFYQTSSRVVNAPVTVDYTNQKFSINNKNIDPRTLTVNVSESDGVKEYTRISNTNSSLSTSSRVYYLESTNSGYTIYFGSPTNTSGYSSGRGVGETEIVYVSYLTTSGSGGNGSTSFSGLGNSITIENSSAVSSGGYDTANIDLIKFAAPRNFVGGGRLISITDYEVAILNTGLLSVGFNPRNNISVYSSSSSADKTSGRILFSMFDAALNGGAGAVISGKSSIPNEITKNFAEEVLVGLTFEYREPLEVDITFTSNEPEQSFTSLYQKGFNQTFSTNLNSSLISVETTKIPDKQKFTTGNESGIESGGTPEISGRFDFKNDIDSTTSGTTFVMEYKTLGSSDNSIATVSGGLIKNGVLGVTLSSDFVTRGKFVLDPLKFQSVEGITLNFSTSKDIIIKDELIVNPKIVGSG
tara:strand:+ start:6422 stop:8113 length:1692 start_codon:yes stop_codon:yes gene_type:complete